MSLRITIAASNGWYKIFETPTYRANKGLSELVKSTRGELRKALTELEEAKKRLALLEEQNQPVTESVQRIYACSCNTCSRRSGVDSK